jgi:hypothetical protein
MYIAYFRVPQIISDGFCQTKIREQKFETTPFSFGDETYGM